MMDDDEQVQILSLGPLESETETDATDSLFRPAKGTTGASSLKFGLAFEAADSISDGVVSQRKWTQASRRAACLIYASREWLRRLMEAPPE